METLIMATTADDIFRKYEEALKWNPAIEELTFAFQPIVNIHSGQLFAVEALLRNCEKAGWATIQDFFDDAAEDDCLYSVDVFLRSRALRLFLQLDMPDTVCLFYNLDNRLLEMPDYSPGNTMAILEAFKMPTHRLYFEVSERHKLDSAGGTTAVDVLNHYKDQDFRIALDDFGTGYAGLQMLYRAEPNLIKIDRFFISGIDTDARKKMFIAGMVETAHVMGISVVAEGVETQAEYHICREIGCDYAQGYYVQSPQIDLSMIKVEYRGVRRSVSANQRNREALPLGMIQKEMFFPPVINESTPLIRALEYFRRNPEWRFFPVINDRGEALGVLRERAVKQFVYSPYGFSLLQNPACNCHLRRALTDVPQVEGTSRLGRVIEAMALDRDAEALIITEDGKYQGMLDSRALVQIMHSMQLDMARDQNPLTRLPGNNLIQEYLFERLADSQQACMLVYFDFDSFKPFNDVFGFRQGDRVIQLFADLMRTNWFSPDSFLGHIGGDDFFLGIHMPLESLESQPPKIQHFLDDFAHSVLAFYSDEARAAGYILS
ncbi:MAG: GGDEF domain-containing protein, partial [Spirochaetaceae bacterium]